MIRPILIWFSTVLILSGGNAIWTPERRARESEQIEYWERKFEDSKNLDPTQKLDTLGLGVRNMGYRSRTDDHNPKIDEIYKSIQAELISIPGHAEYYLDIMEKNYLEFEKYDKQWDFRNPEPFSTERSIALSTLERDRMYALATLRELPSPETLGVLGEMLFDERMKRELLPDLSNAGVVDSLHPASGLAALTLMEMVENPPTSGDFEYDRDMPIWQNWYRQIKEGRRTVRFKGDPQEYDLNGPVREAKNPDIPRATKRPGPAPQEQAAEKPPTPPPSRTPWIAAVLATIATLAGWLFLKKRKVI